MKKLLLFLLLSLSLNVFATTYTVKAGGGGNYTTIQGCANVVVAGDTCTVYTGSYAEIPNITTSGTGTAGVCSACITFNVNTGDIVTVQQFNVSGSYNIIQGFIITEPTLLLGNAGAYIHANTTGVQFINNTFTQVGAHAPGSLASAYPCLSMQDGASHYTLIKGNTFLWCGALASQMNVAAGNPNISSAINVNGDHILVENNDISHVTNGIQLAGGSTSVVIRGNNYHDIYVGTITQTTQSGPPPEFDALGCIEANNCDTHVDYLESTGGGNTRMLFENNTSYRVWGTQGAHTIFASSSTPTDSDWITRFNLIYQMGSAYLANQGFSSNPYGVTYWKDYNNSYVLSQQQNADSPSVTIAGCGQNGQNGSFFNNILYNDTNPAGTLASGYYAWASSTCSSGFRSGYNLAFDSSCTLGTLLDCTSGLMRFDTGNNYGNPQFVNVGTNDFHLTAGSVARLSGTYLTTVANTDSGSGTSLVVNDAAFFQDGFGINTVAGDWISVNNSVAQISSINYTTNTITLTGSLVRSIGDRLCLYKDSSGVVQLFTNTCTPDLGAYQYAAITNAAILVTVSGTGTGTVTSSPVGINCTASCSASFTASTTVTLTATPGAGSTFTGWSGISGCTGTSTCVLTTTIGTYYATATFTSTPPVSNYTLSVAKGGTGTGTVTTNTGGINCGSTCSANYNSGSTVVVTESPLNQSKFIGWSGCSTATTTSITVTMNASKSCTATYKASTKYRAKR